MHPSLLETSFYANYFINFFTNYEIVSKLIFPVLFYDISTLYFYSYI